jgi:hypothetical protein
MTDTTKRDELSRLADSLADTILEMSDDEILKELKTEGVSAEDAARAFDSLLDSARMKAGRNELAKARKEMIADKKAKAACAAPTAEEVRAHIERARRELPQLTEAARNAASGDMSDKDALELFSDLQELGVDFERDE